MDDEPEIREILGFLASRFSEGCDVLTASDASQAEEILRERDVLGVLTDLRMPGKSGLDLIRAINAAAGDTRCALMTGYQEDVVDGVPLESLGLVALLRKPFGSQEAARAIAAITDRKPKAD